MKKLISGLIFLFFFNIGILNALTLDDVAKESKIRCYCNLENINTTPLEVKVAQMLFLGWDLNQVNKKDLKEFLSKNYIGGLQFQTNNIAKDKNIKNFLSSLKEQKCINYFTSIDDNSKNKISLEALLEAGINIISVPKDIQDNFDVLFPFIKESNKNGIITVVKNFTADVTKDSMNLLITQGKYNQFIIPNNLVNKDVDPHNPYSLSLGGLTSYLRGYLNFQGIILNNSLSNTAITSTMPLEKIIIQAIKSGNNMIFFNGLTLENNRLFVQNTTKVIKEALQNKLITMKDINESYIKIINLKHQFYLIPRENWC